MTDETDRLYMVLIDMVAPLATASRRAAYKVRARNSAQAIVAGIAKWREYYDVSEFGDPPPDVRITRAEVVPL